MQNRRVMPELFYKDKVVRTTLPEENAKIDTAKAARKKFDEGKAKAQGAYKEKLKEGAMNRSYTIDEMTVATLLKGHPQAQEIFDNIFKSKKEKNESGEEFQDGSEDTIGGEGHAAVARPDSIKHEGKPSGIGPNEPGTGTKKASVEDGDLEKSDNLADNLPEEFEDEMEDDDTIPPEKGGAKKSMTLDEKTLSHLLKTMGADRMEEILKAVIGGASVDPAKRRMLAQMPGAYKDTKSGEDSPLTNRKVNPTALAALKQTVGTGGASKSDDDKPKPSLKNLIKDPGSETAGKSEESDLEKSEENMGEDYSLDFSKSILERMGLEKGATSVSKEAGGGKATQINYGSKPTTKFKHPKAKADKKYIHSPAKGTVKVEKEGEKTREIGVGEEAKLKNASVSSEDLYKSLDAILDKKRD